MADLNKIGQTEEYDINLRSTDTGTNTKTTRQFLES